MAKKKNTHLSSKKESSIFSTFLPFFTLGALYLSYYVYEAVIAPLPAPEMDLIEWWGPALKETQDVTIRPFKVEFSDVMVNDLKERLLHRHPFAPPLDGVGFTYGFNTNFLTQVLDYWQNKYDFKDRERFFNKYEHFKTNIQGLDLHFIRVKPNVDVKYTVVPLLLLHGWPGSVREFYEIIPKLTTPREGYNIVFEVIVPSLPGYGFSDGAIRPGLGAAQVAVVMHNLMARIGHTHYYVQGGDWGSAIASNMATLFQDNVLGYHTNMPYAPIYSPVNFVKSVFGSFWPSLIVEDGLEDRMYPLSKLYSLMMESFGYLHLQATRPDSLGVALTDSPAGLAAYILEKFSDWTNLDYKYASDGELLKKYTLTNLLDNVMVYWSTNCITTSMRFYAETLSKAHSALQLDRVQTTVPTWGIKFKHDFYVPDNFLKSKYLNYLHSTIVDDGGHFAAFENPDILADDIYEAVKTFIEFHEAKKLSAVTEKSDTKFEQRNVKTIHDFNVKDINGNEVKLNKYKGHVSIIVNVASQCGLTDTNYKQLNILYEKYAESKGLRILAFPCNQFNGQEPGSAEEIKEFIKERGVKFDLFEKIEVNGENTHPLWVFLKSSQAGTLGDFIKWNFSKFIIDKDGLPVERFAPNVDPLELEKYLEKYW